MSTSQPVEHLRLNNGVEIPRLGLGVFEIPHDDAVEAVRTALQHGYRLVDTASAYRNERAVGEAIRTAGVPRNEIFVTTKAFPSQYGAEATPRAVAESLDRLGLDYLDLYLLHWPVPSDFETTLEAYRAAESVLASGRVRALGVSNFGADDLDRLLSASDVIPAVNQVELHPFFSQEGLRTKHAELGIVTQAWSPIGGSVIRNAPGNLPGGVRNLLDHPVLTRLAVVHDKSPAQIVLRWHLAHDVVAIPKSSRANRIIENIDLFDFTLSAEEMARIDALDTGVRVGADPARFVPDDFPVDIDDQ